MCILVLVLIYSVACYVNLAFVLFSRSLDDDFDYNYDYKDLEDFVLLTATSVYDIQV